MSRNVCRYVSHVEEEVEGCEVPDKAGVGAVSKVEDGVNGVLEVGARSINSHR